MNRRTFVGSSSKIALLPFIGSLLPLSLSCEERNELFFKISLNQWSLWNDYVGDSSVDGWWSKMFEHLENDPTQLLQGELDPMEFPTLTREVYGLDAIELEASYKFRLALLYDNDIIEAKRILKEVQRINPALEYKAWKAFILAVEGKKNEALNLYPAPSSILYFLLDMPKEAIQRVDSMTAVTSFTGEWTYLELKNMRFTEFIRDEPRFKEILAEAKKVHEERVAKYGHLFDEQ